MELCCCEGQREVSAYPGKITWLLSECACARWMVTMIAKEQSVESLNFHTRRLPSLCLTALKRPPNGFLNGAEATGVLLKGYVDSPITQLRPVISILSSAMMRQPHTCKAARTHEGRPGCNMGSITDRAGIYKPTRRKIQWRHAWTHTRNPGDCAKWPHLSNSQWPEDVPDKAGSCGSSVGPCACAWWGDVMSASAGRNSTSQTNTEELCDRASRSATRYKRLNKSQN